MCSILMKLFWKGKLINPWHDFLCSSTTELSVWLPKFAEKNYSYSNSFSDQIDIRFKQRRKIYWEMTVDENKSALASWKSKPRHDKDPLNWRSKNGHREFESKSHVFSTCLNLAPTLPRAPTMPHEFQFCDQASVALNSYFQPDTSVQVICTVVRMMRTITYYHVERFP